MYGLIGKKLGHSFSADFFNKKFEKEGIDESYHLFPLESIEKFPELLDSQPELKGLNVTIPYKQEVMRYLDEIDDDAEKIGAINVIKISNKGAEKYLKGYNSDYIGFLSSLQPLLTPEIKSGLILGTGGASKAVAYALKKLGIDVTFVSRNPLPGQLSYEDLDEDIINRNLLIVNTTPLGMSPDISSYPPIPYHYLTDKHLCYDLVYNPLETEFLKRCKEQGTQVKNGLEMLYNQALAAWDIWND